MSKISTICYTDKKIAIKMDIFIGGKFKNAPRVEVIENYTFIPFILFIPGFETHFLKIKKFFLVYRFLMSLSRIPVAFPKKKNFRPDSQNHQISVIFRKIIPIVLGFLFIETFCHYYYPLSNHNTNVLGIHVYTFYLKTTHFSDQIYFYEFSRLLVL